MEQKMKTIPFDVELAKKIQAGEQTGKIMTKDGRSVRIVCFDAFSAYPLVVLINDGKKECCMMYNEKGGISWADESDTDDNLVIQVPVQKPEYNFEPFQKVLVRSGNGWPWEASLFSHIGDKEDSPYVTVVGFTYEQCIPYNEETKHLLGTTDNWEE